MPGARSASLGHAKNRNKYSALGAKLREGSGSSRSPSPTKAASSSGQADDGRDKAINGKRKTRAVSGAVEGDERGRSVIRTNLNDDASTRASSGESQPRGTRPPAPLSFDHDELTDSLLQGRRTTRKSWASDDGDDDDYLPSELGADSTPKPVKRLTRSSTDSRSITPPLPSRREKKVTIHLPDSSESEGGSDDDSIPKPDSGTTSNATTPPESRAVTPPPANESKYPFHPFWWGGSPIQGDDEADFNPKIEAFLREMGENLKFASYLVNGVIAARDEGKVVDLIPASTAIANVSKDARTWRIARTKELAKLAGRELKLSEGWDDISEVGEREEELEEGELLEAERRTNGMERGSSSSGEPTNSPQTKQGKSCKADARQVTRKEFDSFQTRVEGMFEKMLERLPRVASLASNQQAAPKTKNVRTLSFAEAAGGKANPLPSTRPPQQGKPAGDQPVYRQIEVAVGSKEQGSSRKPLELSLVILTRDIQNMAYQPGLVYARRVRALIESTESLKGKLVLRRAYQNEKKNIVLTFEPGENVQRTIDEHTQSLVETCVGQTNAQFARTTNNDMRTSLIVKFAQTGVYQMENGEVADPLSPEEVINELLRDNVFKGVKFISAPYYTCPVEKLKREKIERCPIGLTFEDPEGEVSARLLRQKRVLFWGESCFLAVRKQLPPWKLCQRCGSTTHNNDANRCRRPPKCLRCGANHPTTNHRAECQRCKDEKVKATDCPHTPVCSLCSCEGHVTGASECPERRKFAAEVKGRQTESTTTREEWVEQKKKSRSGAKKSQAQKESEAREKKDREEAERQRRIVDNPSSPLRPDGELMDISS